MALKLTGADDTTIMKMGHWTSLTFLQYIHEQIAHLSADISTQMSTQIEFTPLTNKISAISVQIVNKIILKYVIYGTLSTIN
jgi:hypothetical protein